LGQPPSRLGDWEDVGNHRQKKVNVRGNNTEDVVQGLGGSGHDSNVVQPPILNNVEREVITDENESVHFHSSASHCPSSVTKYSRVSSVQRRKKEAELEAARQISKLEEEAEVEKMRLEKIMLEKKLERQRTLIQRQLQLTKDQIEEEEEFEDVRSEIIIPNQNSQSQPENVDKESQNVQDWLQRVNHQEQHQYPDASSIGQLAEAITKAVQLSISSSTPRDDSSVEMKKFVARQTAAKELTPFNGDPEDWPNFIAEFNGSNAALRK